MGLYVEPKMEKDVWCKENCREVNTEVPVQFSDANKDQVILCLVNNGFFFALAVAFSEAEFKVFRAPDGRPKKWYVVDKEVVKLVTPAWEHYIKE